MPVSPYHYVSTNCALMVQEFPTSVLDVGVGHGKWGFLCRDVLEGFVGTRYFKRDWKVRVDGIEIFAEYHNPVWDYAYDSVWIGDACEIVPRLDAYDLVFAMEVIEHLEKSVGLRLVADLVACAVRGLVLAFPDAEHPDALAQSDSYGNPHERHRSLWSPADLAAYRCETVSPNHVLVRDPAKRRIPARELAERTRGPMVMREASKGCELPAQPWCVLTEPASLLRVPFTGRRAHLYYVGHAYCGQADVLVDGRPTDRISMATPGPSVYACWRSPRLPPGEHVVELRPVPDPATGRSEVWLDDLVVQG